MRNLKFTIFKILLFTCTLFLLCTCGNRSKASKGDESHPTVVSKSLYHNPDSLLFWAKRAYMHDDPQGLYITGAAAFLRIQDPDFPDSCTTVPIEEARIMLLRAAELNEPNAKQLIHCLQSEGCWEDRVTEK